MGNPTEDRTDNSLVLGNKVGSLNLTPFRGTYIVDVLFMHISQAKLI